jgi:hypothetical protein
VPLRTPDTAAKPFERLVALLLTAEEALDLGGEFLA